MRGANKGQYRGASGEEEKQTARQTEKRMGKQNGGAADRRMRRTAEPRQAKRRQKGRQKKGVTEEPTSVTCSRHDHNVGIRLFNVSARQHARDNTDIRSPQVCRNIEEPNADVMIG